MIISRVRGLWQSEHLPVLVVYILAFALFCAAAIPAYYHDFIFGWDGFTLFNALRNFVDRGSFWEGPSVGYILGVHSFWTLYLLAPLIALFRSPIVLLIASIASSLISSFLVYMIAFRRLGDRLIGFLFGLLYLAFPVVYGQIFGRDNIFQVDYMMPVFLLSMIYIVSCGYNPEGKDNSSPKLSRLFYVFWLLFLATKEEYIPAGVAVIAWLYFDDRFITGKSTLGSRRALITTGVIFLVIALADVVSLPYFRGLTEKAWMMDPVGGGHFLQGFTQSNPHPLSETLASAELWQSFYTTLVQMLVPLSPVIIAAFAVAKPVSRIYLLISLAVFLIFRTWANHFYIYCYPIYITHWSYMVVGATIIPSFIAVFSYCKKPPTSYKTLLVPVLLLSIGVSLASDLYWPKPKFTYTKRILSGLAKPRYQDGFTQQLIAISSSLPKPDRSRLETVCLAQTWQWPFVERSDIGYLTLLRTIENNGPEVFKKRLEQVDWIIVDKNDIGALAILTAGRSVYLTTEDLVVYGR